MLVDSHCHLEKAIKKGNLADWLSAMEAGQVGHLITVGTSTSDWEMYRQVAAEHPDKISWTVGLHPCSVDAGWEDDVAAISTFFSTTPEPVALGEIGLDYFHLPKYPDEIAEMKARQRSAFQHQLSLAFQFDCAVVVHSRNAFRDCVEEIDRSGVDWKQVVFHCFAEGPEELAMLSERGGRASFTGIVTYKNRSVLPVREALIRQGLDRLMIETDAPYLTPEPHRGKPNQPAYVAYVAQVAADLLGVDWNELVSATSRNTRNFFGIRSDG